MAGTSSTSTTNCATCGGKLTFDFKRNFNKCEYCGNEFAVTPAQVQAGREKAIPKSYIPFSFSIEQFTDKILHWFAEGDYTPVDLLCPRKPFELEKRYIPVYFFGGEYTGKYSSFVGNSIASENVPLTGKYEIFCYGSERAGLEEGLVYAMLPQINLGTAISIDAPVASEKAVWAPVVGKDDVWDKYGNLEAAQYVYNLLASQGGNKSYKHYLSYANYQVSILYLPFYFMAYDYRGNQQLLFANGLTGEIFGEKPISSFIAPPTRSRFFWKSLLRGLGGWFVGTSVLSLVYPVSEGHNPGTLSSSIFLVSMVSFFIVLFILPIVMPIFVYPHTRDAYFNKLRGVRAQILDLIITGRKASPFA